MKTYIWSLVLATLAFSCQMQENPISPADDKSSAGPPTPGAYVISSSDSEDGKSFTITVDQSAAQATSNMVFQLFDCDGNALTVGDITSFKINGADAMGKLNSSVGDGTACSTAYPDPYIHLQQSIQPDIYVIELSLNTPSKGGSFVIKSTNKCFGVNDPAYALTHDCTPPPTCYQDDSAWSAGSRYVSRGNWATFTTYASGGKVNVYAGQNKFAGTATMSAVGTDGNVTITIALNEGWSLQEVTNPVKIQGYSTQPSGNPSPGRFTSKGTSLTVKVPAANFYGIHLDVRQAVACPN